jgi:hypothetical protein
LAADALADAAVVAAYAAAFTGRSVGFQALKEAGWAAGDPVPDGVLLPTVVLGLASRGLGDQAAWERSRAFVASQGLDIEDPALLERLRRAHLRDANWDAGAVVAPWPPNPPEKPAL